MESASKCFIKQDIRINNICLILLFLTTTCKPRSLFIVPRTFRLYEELEKAEKAKLSDQSVSYGLTKGKYRVHI